MTIDKMASCGLYKIENTTNGKCYYGQTSVRLFKRKTAHFNLLASNKHSNKHLQAAYNKDGVEAFTFTVIVHGLKKSQLDGLECQLISIFNTTDPRFGYNKHPGGGCKEILPETKEKFRQNKLGSKMTDRTREAIKKANTGRPCSPETRKKISESHAGKKSSPEAILKGILTRQEYYKNGGVSPRAIPVVDSDGVCYLSMSHAANTLKATPACISRAIKNGTRCRGRYFKYLVDGDK